LCWAELPELPELVDEEDDDDGDGDALEVWAWAMAAPPPTRTPERVNAARACLSRRVTFDHLLSRSGDGSKSTGAA